MLQMIAIAAPIFKHHFQPEASMTKLREKGMTFKNFPEALYATDVKFFPGHKPIGEHNQVKNYFSGKHHFYGQKAEASVLPTGLACNWTEPVPGATHDKAIFETNLEYHLEATKKTTAELAEVDRGEGARSHPNHHAILQDMAYIGCEKYVRSITPKKQYRGRPLPYDERKRNKAVGSDRIMPENYFGRNVILFPVLGQRWPWARDKLGMTIDFCFSLTNFHILMHPLRDRDHEYYLQAVSDLMVSIDEHFFFISITQFVL